MAKTYEIKFDRAKKAYEPVDITAVLKKVVEGGDIEVESQVAFNVDIPKLLDFQIRKEDKSFIATVTVTQEAQARDDYDEVIAKPIQVEVSAKPTEEGEKAPLIKEKCEVKIAPLPVLAKFIKPADSELPWPAIKERTLDVEVQLFKMKGGQEVPLAKATVDVERPKRAKPEAGEFDSKTQPPFTTDDQGYLRFTYVPPTAEYRLTGEYVEQFRFVSVSGDKRQELLLWELPLAPSYNYCLTVEKQNKDNDRLLGLYTGEEKLFVDIPADSRALRFKGLVDIEMKEAIAPAGPGMQVGPNEFVRLQYGDVRLEVRNESGEYSLVTGDEYIAKRTDKEGTFVWKPKGTANLVAGKPPELFELLRKDQRIPLIVGYPTTKTALEAYGHKVDHLQKSSLYSLITSGMSDRLLLYPSKHITRHAEWPIIPYPRLCSHAYLLGGVAGYSTIYYNMVSGLMGTMPEKLSQMFSDLISLGVTWAGFGDNLKNWLSAARTWVGEFLSKLATKAVGAENAGAIAEFLQAIGQTVSDAASYVGQLCYDWVIQPGVNAIIRAFRWAVKGLQEILEALVGYGWDWMGSQVRSLCQRLEAAVERLASEGDGVVRGTLDVVLEWFGRILTIAWDAAMILMEAVGCVITFVLAKVIHSVRFVFSHLGIDWDQTLSPGNFEILRRIFGEGVEGWGQHWSEILEGLTNNQLQEWWEKFSKYVGGTAGAGVVGGAGGLTYRVPMAAGTNAMIWWVDGMLKDQNSNIPTDYEARQEKLSKDTTELRTTAHTFETSSAKLDIFFAWADLILTIAIGVIMAFSGALKALVRFLLSKFGKALPDWLNASADSMMKKLDVAQVILAALKCVKTLFMDLLGTMGLGIGIFFQYLWAMWNFVTVS
jgi:hypothetical protein